MGKQAPRQKEKRMPVIIRSVNNCVMWRRWENCPEDDREGPVVEDVAFAGDVMVGSIGLRGLNPNTRHCKACAAAAAQLNLDYDKVQAALAAIREPQDAIFGNGHYSTWTSGVSLTNRFIIINAVGKTAQANIQPTISGAISSA